MGLSLTAAALVLATAVLAQAAANARARARTLGRITPVEDRWRALHPGMGRFTLRLSRSRSDLDVAATARAIARSLRAGLSPAQALAAAEASVPRVVASTARDAGLGEASAAWRTHDQRAAVRLLTTALDVGAAAGGSLARSLDAVADTVECRAAVDREMWSQAATARASAAVLATAPIAFSGFAMVGDRSALVFLTRTGPGIGCLAIAAALDIAGMCWMAKITAGGP